MTVAIGELGEDHGSVVVGSEGLAGSPAPGPGVAEVLLPDRLLLHQLEGGVVEGLGVSLDPEVVLALQRKRNTLRPSPARQRASSHTTTAAIGEVGQDQGSVVVGSEGLAGSLAPGRGLAQLGHLGPLLLLLPELLIPSIDSRYLFNCLPFRVCHPSVGYFPVHRFIELTFLPHSCILFAERRDVLYCYSYTVC